MLSKILKNDFQRKKGISAALLGFVTLSAILIASGVYVVMVLLSSMDNLFAESKIPHFMQMHSGEAAQDSIDEFTASNDLVDKQQTVKMINIDGMNIYFGDREESEVNSVMDISVVVQNKEFDYLLNMDNEIAQVQKGQIAIPVYYMQEYDLEVGDKVRLKTQDFDLELTISEFTRDAQMNSSMVSSKRLLVSQEDYDLIDSNMGEYEYMIEYLLKDVSDVGTFETMYQDAGMPATGPALNYSTYQLLTALSDGIVAVVIILVGILLVVISILCIRFTFLATLEEEYKEIGVLKAIGMKQQHIKRIYLVKYMAIGAIASIAGYVCFFFVGDIFTSNILLYLGSARGSIIQYIVPLIGILIMYLFLCGICLVILRRFKKISAVEAIRAGSIDQKSVHGKRVRIFNAKISNMNFMLSLKDIMTRLKMYSALLIVFTIAVFIMIVPLNLLNTLKSESFISYLGIGYSDIRIDFQKSDDINERYSEILADLKQDSDVSAYSPSITSRYQVLGSDDTWENINIEVGDFTIFPLEYLKGSAPDTDYQIALSYLLSEELEKGVGDTLTAKINNQSVELTVCGIYQDITNGGNTAKAVIPQDLDTTVWYTISLDLKDSVSVESKVDEYANRWEGAKITSLDDYLSQTLESTISQLKVVVILAIVLAVFISILITCLFLKLLVAKDQQQNAVLRGIGFSLGDVKKQYMIRMILLLAIGVILGVIVSGTLGESVVGMAMSSLGASKISLIINPLISYVVCPIALFVIVIITTLICIAPMKKTNISRLITE